MNKFLLGLMVLVLATLACGSTLATPQVVIQTVVVQPTALPPTAVPPTARPTAAPSFDPLALGWERMPEADEYCDRVGCAFQYRPTGELMHVYDNELVFGWDLSNTNPNAGAMSGQASAAFGAPSSVGDVVEFALSDPNTWDLLWNGGTYQNEVDGWHIAVTVDADNLFLVLVITKISGTSMPYSSDGANG